MMNKKALLLTGFLSKNNITDIQNNVTGTLLEEEKLIEILKKGNEKKSDLDYKAGYPEISFIDKKYSEIINEINEGYNENDLKKLKFSFKLIDICPLLCDAVFLDLDKINYFTQKFVSASYDEVLKICLGLQKVEMKINIVNNGVVLNSDDPNIMGFILTNDIKTKDAKLQVHFNPSPVKVIRKYDRYLLIDGRKRAIALYNAGHKKIPVLLFDSYTLKVPELTYRFVEGLLISNNPPTIGHFVNKEYVSEVPFISNTYIHRLLIDRITIQV